jgi:hypothetical protein
MVSSSARQLSVHAPAFNIARTGREQVTVAPRHSRKIRHLPSCFDHLVLITLGTPVGAAAHFLVGAAVKVRRAGINVPCPGDDVATPPY